VRQGLPGGYRLIAVPYGSTSQWAPR
jgi:hypothetical protein